jgi:hypothetical protein
VAVRHSRAFQRLSSATRQAESRPSRIGPINLGMKQMGERSAGNPHAAFDVEGTGDVARSKLFGLNRRANPRPYQNVVGKEIPFTEMRDTFIRSVEFRQNVIGRIGGMLKPLDWGANPVETEVDDDTLALLYEHVEQVWSNLGSAEPHYSVLTNQKFKSGRFKQHAAEFFSSGSNSLQVFQKTLERNSINVSRFPISGLF